MNVPLTVIRKTTTGDVTTGPLPASRKIFVAGEQAGVRVPKREISLHESALGSGLAITHSAVLASSFVARPLRIEFPHAVYHVTSRGNARQKIVRHDDDRRRFLTTLAQVTGHFGWLCHAYCLMDNHYHLLVETPLGDLSRAIRYLNGVYTQYINRRYRRVGHLFQGRYKAILIDKDSYLIELSRYIHLNPWRVRGGGRDPLRYRWSSLRAYIGREKAPEWLETDEILGLFGQKRGKAQRAYGEFVREGMERGIKTPWDEVRWQSLLGSSSFVEEIENRFLRDREIGLTEMKGLRESRKRVKAERLVRVVCAYYKIKPEDLPKRSHEYTEAREVASYIMRRYGLMRLVEIGEQVALHYSTVGNVVRKVAGSKDRRLRAALNKIEAEIKNP